MIKIEDATGGKAKTGAQANFSIASVQIVFQTRPGVGDGKIIKDAGDLTLYFRSGGTRVVESKKGVYHFDSQSNSEPVLEFLESQFTLRFLKKGDKDTNGSGIISHWEGPLENANSLMGVQQRLQLLGYYTGSVDGRMGAKSERAILEFQADEGTLLIDGVAGPKTQAALDGFFEKHGYDTTRKHYLIRRYLARFERARVGDSHASCPHPDYRGGDNTVATYGYKVTAFADRDRGTRAPGESFRIGLDFEGYSLVDETRIFPKFRKNPDFARVILEQANGKHQSQHNYQKPVLAITPLAVDGEDILDLHHGSDQGPVVASLELKTPSMRQVMVAMHLLTIKDAAGNSVPPWTAKEAMGLMDMVNAVWMPMGIEFQVREVQNNEFIGINSGAVTNDNTGRSGFWPEYLQIWKKFNVKEVINIYFSESIIDLEINGLNVEAVSGALGFALSRKAWAPAGKKSDQPIGCCVRKDPDLFNLALTVAHELGHVLNLTCHKHAHSDDNDTPVPFRHDIWSRTRLMAKYSNYDLRNPPRLWQDSTYGKHGASLQCGGWLTIKKVLQDGTDDEFQIARDLIDQKPNALY